MKKYCLLINAVLCVGWAISASYAMDTNNWLAFWPCTVLSFERFLDVVA